jgi:SpoVK/Ycf46/Vps4 family AAA+-type ATPase
VAVDSSTIIELRPRAAERYTPQQEHSNASTNARGHRRTGSAVTEIDDETRKFVSWASVESPADKEQLQHAAAEYDRLVGVPKEEILADIETRMLGREWLWRWSRQHYGAVIPGATSAASSTPLLLLAGDPGTGKSVLLRTAATLLAHRLNAPILFVQLNARLRGEGIQGKAGTDVVGVLDQLAKASLESSMPALILLDEADSVVGSRSSQDGSSGAFENVAIVNAVIDGLDRIFSRSDARLVFTLATNLVGRIDPAVTRRATIYTFSRPSKEDRRTIVEVAFQGVVARPSVDEINNALDRSGLPLTAADVLNQVVDRAIREAAQRNRPLDVARVIELARKAVATPIVDGR